MSNDRVDLDCSVPIWERFFSVNPLVVIGTRELDGSHDLAPKHLAGPVSWENLFGFVCSDSHATLRNAARTGVFTVSYPRPGQIVETSLSAAPRRRDDTKPALDLVATVPASVVDGVLLADAVVHLECEVDRIVDGLGDNSLVVGTVVAASVDEPAVRHLDRDDAEVVAAEPLLAYLYPGRYAVIDSSHAFPFHLGWTR